MIKFLSCVLTPYVKRPQETRPVNDFQTIRPLFSEITSTGGARTPHDGCNLNDLKRFRCVSDSVHTFSDPYI
ncbi:uncharacterized protein PHALS_03930 [Plasmopara halstedii]|uniref:Uncharacterized protein n=1 Tax=Plasmopara halstedii TaxID=4781 RepID=A0A0P1A8L6_PLAHL|nr:uncharacterized protein PHALS_03930 [Plasmopara halstedii]CEG36722.1 hypothetical protein PHALS_03930 [Plasmopara halstedii]|eukprot:XP_024573091.1 hypothetical protein PHALS_03930 [Plasmopara halstedii]